MFFLSSAFNLCYLTIYNPSFNVLFFNAFLCYVILLARFSFRWRPLQKPDYSSLHCFHYFKYTRGILIGFQYLVMFRDEPWRVSQYAVHFCYDVHRALNFAWRWTKGHKGTLIFPLFPSPSLPGVDAHQSQIWGCGEDINRYLVKIYDHCFLKFLQNLIGLFHFLNTG